MKRLLVILLISMSAYTQNTSSILSFEEYIGYVKSFHPLVKQANLALSDGEANLLKARGAFDPKIEVDFNRKDFKSTEYYDMLAATFKVPTWYGIELKARFEEADGFYLNPQNTTPDEGLYTAGISFSVAQGLLINERMAALKQAKFYLGQRKADRDILVNNVLYEAALAYFDWLNAYNRFQIHSQFLENAEIRAQAIRESIERGDKPAIDSVEAGITVKNRKLSIEKSNLKFRKASLKLSNFLWLDNNIPLELKESVIPDVDALYQVDTVLTIDQLQLNDSLIVQHPKMISLDYKYKQLEVDKKLKLNKLLPTLNLEYNFLSENTGFNTFNTANYKSGVYFRMPLFLRKERGDFNLAKLKLQDLTYEITSTKLSISNKLKAMEQELTSLEKQQVMIQDVVANYQRLLSAEERKLELGDSSLFLINSRENSLMDAKLKQVDIQYELLEAKANLFNSIAVNPTSVQ